MPPIGEHRDPRWVATEQPAAVSAPPSADGGASSPKPAQLWWEITAVACIAVFPLLFDLALSDEEPSAPRQDRAALIAHIGWSICTTVPILWIARRGGMAWRDLGIVRPRAVDLVSCAVLVILSIGVDRLTWIAFVGGTGVEPAPLQADPRGLAPVAIMVVAHLANGFAEEVAMRGYLLPRLRAATGSLPAAIALSTLAFASYHGYQGAGGVVNAALFGLLYALAFLVLRKVGILALAHAASNLWNIYVAHP